MSWATAELSTATSLAKHETEINDLTSSDWSDKISIAKAQKFSYIVVYALNTVK